MAPLQIHIEAAPLGRVVHTEKLGGMINEGAHQYLDENMDWKRFQWVTERNFVTGDRLLGVDLFSALALSGHLRNTPPNCMLAYAFTPEDISRAATAGRVGKALLGLPDTVQQALRANLSDIVELPFKGWYAPIQDTFNEAGSLRTVLEGLSESASRYANDLAGLRKAQGTGVAVTWA